MLIKIFRSICFCSIAFLHISCDGEEQKSPSLESQTLDNVIRYAQGHRDFQNFYFKTNEKEFIRLVEEGQTPKTLFISCSDSRVIPELFLKTNPGDLFVIRTAGNFVPINTPHIKWEGVSATIQYAIEVLNIKEIIVCGHSDCGAISALYKKLDPEKFDLIIKWLDNGQQAKKSVLENTNIKTLTQNQINTLTEQISVLYQLDHLMSYPFIKKRVDSGEIHLHGWHWDIKTGKIAYYNTEKETFVNL